MLISCQIELLLSFYETIWKSNSIGNKLSNIRKGMSELIECQN
jgi:hypothetical protein